MRAFLILCACLLGFARPAHAQVALRIEALPVLGANSPSVDGWGEIQVRLENNGAAPLSGFVELRTTGGGRASPRVLSRAPFALAVKARVSLLLPSHGLVARSFESKIVAVDRSGEVLNDVVLPASRALDPLIFDLDLPSRVAPLLNTQPLPIRRRGMGFYGGATLAITSPQVNPTTGELALPDLAAGYASATLVLANGRTLSRLSPPALDALCSWVLAGGALAVVVDRPEDLRSPWLEALAGGHVTSSAASRQLSGVSQFAVPVETSGKGGFGAPRINVESAKPSAELIATFFGLSGANLRVSPWGEAASYGLGEVHFLAFDPDTELAANDPWARLKVLDLVRHAWERSSAVALPHGQASLDDSRLDEIRRVLDPNEATRWTVVVSTLLLLIYAALAGPLNFYLAQRAGKPLRALIYLPVWAALAMASIVALGILGKGVNGRARHLTLIEAGAGMARASITRFRGLYAARADDVTVRAQRGSVLDVVGEPDDVSRDLIVDRDGVRLERLRQKPWQVQVVREDGFTNVGAGVSLVLEANGELAIKNRCARDLRAVIVKGAQGGFSYFPKVADGETVHLKQGRPLGAVPAPSPYGTHVLSAGNFHDEVESVAKGAGAAWSALETLTGSDADWWPEDVPVLIGELEGGEGRTRDSGLNVDVDRVLVRVVGYGGVL